jgi:hypothetical protein
MKMEVGRRKSYITGRYHRKLSVSVAKEAEAKMTN